MAALWPAQLPERGQLHALPQRAIGNRFSSISGHADLAINTHSRSGSSPFIESYIDCSRFFFINELFFFK
jgi:hypothetical protein